jgi:hypothetical protein
VSPGIKGALSSSGFLILQHRQIQQHKQNDIEINNIPISADAKDIRACLWETKH